jgi:cellulose synthase/poly-beta-1,6-N-acetylglucosamine synthase-like glycosyltransferase
MHEWSLYIYLFLSTFPVVVYVFVILNFRRSWNKFKIRQVSSDDFPFISVVVPFRNEKEQLPQLISLLMHQQYPQHKFEVIAVDDHSTDGTAQNLSEQCAKWPNLSILSCNEYGKKNALRTGINKATGRIITTVDADCIPTIKWLGAIANSYNSTKAAMLIGPVKMIANTTLFSRFQSFDFMALQMSGAGAAMQGWPVFCSGANLTFEKSAWQTAQSTLSGQEQASGDDVFLLHAFKKLGLPIAFIKDEAAMVSTHTEKTVKSFLKQRMRWGGKSKSYSDIHTILLAILVLFANVSLLIALVSGLINFTYLVFFLMLFAIKSMADYRLLLAGQGFFGNKPPFLPFLIFSMVYPFYIILAAIGGLMLNTTWKGRK